MENNEMFRILIADNDIDVHRTLGDCLKGYGYKVFSAYDGLQAIKIGREINPDLVIMDIAMDANGGLQACREIRRNSDVPIIALTTKSGESDCLMGFELGVDDYITKPFSAHEVLARIKAILRRFHTALKEEEKSRIKVENLEVDMAAFMVRLDGKPVACTPKEIEILWLLTNNPGRVFSRESLLQNIWGYDYLGDTRAVDSHIKRIRAKVCKKGNKWDITTVWGVGYRFERLEVME